MALCFSLSFFEFLFWTWPHVSTLVFVFLFAWPYVSTLVFARSELKIRSPNNQGRSVPREEPGKSVFRGVV